MAGTAVENLVAEYRTARSQEHQTTADRVAKQLAALGYGTNGKPLAGPDAPSAAAERKAAAGPGPEARAEPPKGRTTASPRSAKT